MSTTKSLCSCLFLLLPVACGGHSEVRSIRAATDSPARVVFSSKGDKVYSCWENGVVRIYESASGKLLKESKVSDGTQPLHWIDVTEDEEKILVGAFVLNDMMILDAKLQPIKALKGRFEGASAFAVSPDQSKLLSGGSGFRRIQLYDLKTGEKTKSMDNLPQTENPLFFDYLGSIDFSKDSKMVLLTNLDWGAHLWDVEKWKMAGNFRGTGTDRTSISSAVFNHDEKKIITADGVGDIRVFDRLSGKEVAIDRVRKKRNSALAAHPKQDKILSGGADGKVIYWNVEERKEVASWSFEGMTTSLAISRDGKYAACTTKHAIHIWDLPK